MTWRTYDNLGREQVAPLASPPGAWEFIEKKVASASAEIDFDLPTGFNVYMLTFEALVPATDDVKVFLRVSNDGGSTFRSGASDYDYTSRTIDEVAAESTTGSGSANAVEVIQDEGAAGGGVGNAAGESADSQIMIYSARDSNAFTLVRFDGNVSQAAGGFARYYGAGRVATAEVNDAVRIFLESGNITSGNFMLYGLRETTAPGSDGAPQAFRSRQVFTASGTWNRPPGITKAYVEVIGGGGGGGGAAVTVASQGAEGGGGGGGGYASSLLDVSAISTSTITVGDGGAGGAAGNNAGATGGNSSWADGTNTLTGNGGVGGNGGAAAAGSIVAGGAGGAASGGTLNVPGSEGLSGRVVNTAEALSMGFGGASHFGSMIGTQNVNLAGRNAQNYGSGGSSGSNQASQTAKAGGNGSGGIIIVWEFA